MSEPLSKTALRGRILARREGIGAVARRRGSEALRAHLAVHPLLADAGTVIAYAATPAEVDLDALCVALTARGVRVVLPWVDGTDLHLAVVADLEADLAPGYMGVREPIPDRRQPVDPAEADVALVPGVAFDRRGGRLGYGGGHFDRLLARLAPTAAVIGVCFTDQVVDRVPTEPHDVLVGHLATEEGVRPT